MTSPILEPKSPLPSALQYVVAEVGRGGSVVGTINVGSEVNGSGVGILVGTEVEGSIGFGVGLLVCVGLGVEGSGGGRVGIGTGANVGFGVRRVGRGVDSAVGIVVAGEAVGF